MGLFTVYPINLPGVVPGVGLGLGYIITGVAVTISMMLPGVGVAVPAVYVSVGVCVNEFVPVCVAVGRASRFIPALIAEGLVTAPPFPEAVPCSTTTPDDSTL